MKNKELLYLALAIGGAFLIHKLMMSKMSDKVSTPVSPVLPPNVVPTPGTMFTQSTIKSMALTELQNDNINETALTNIHSSNEYDITKTYQNFYGKSIGNMYKSCPTFI